jgi:enoyl-CoA hydratase/carnithine racemase
MTYTAQEHICLNEARTKIVPCDSPEAAMTLALPGVAITDEQAEQYGLVKKSADKEEKAEAAAPENKAVAAPPANKQKGK